ncbi:hypothetical protein AV530_009477 [Patagioenas fasciata monilis]|uniref:Tim44-like domain-containing protein n=1 Tax=Patagioenas fasciata monilis TaxID=372326 RepID=A0A1V4JZX6_PATFA|nr:hypothetical protein AV530_009477 [Patagioenas fasciata monilis]
MSATPKRGPPVKIIAYNLTAPKLAMGKMMEQGPVLIITFQAQVVMVIKNQSGEVVEGDPGAVRTEHRGGW